MDGRTDKAKTYGPLTTVRRAIKTPFIRTAYWVIVWNRWFSTAGILYYIITRQLGKNNAITLRTRTLFFSKPGGTMFFSDPECFCIYCYYRVKTWLWVDEYYNKHWDKHYKTNAAGVSFVNGFSVLIIWFIDEQECFIAIITHTYVTKMLFLQSYLSYTEKKLTLFGIFPLFLFNIVMRNCSSKTAHCELCIRHIALLLVVCCANAVPWRSRQNLSTCSLYI